MRNYSISTCLVVGVALFAIAACNQSQNPTQSNTDSQVISKNVLRDPPPYFEHDLYVTDSGERLPISTVASELIEFAVPQDFRFLVEMADAIVVGKPLESLEDSEIVILKDSPLKEAATLSGLEVETVLKGDLESGEMIRLGQNLAISSDKGYRLPTEHPDWHEQTLVSNNMKDYRPVRKDSKYLLFLYQRSVAGSDTYFPIAGALGRVNLDGTDEIDAQPFGDVEKGKKMRKWAIVLYNAALQNPAQDVVEQVAKQSEVDFEEGL